MLFLAYITLTKRNFALKNENLHLFSKMVFLQGKKGGLGLMSSSWAVNVQLVSLYTEYFDLGLLTAGVVASSFGLMNLVSRSLGGMSSDFLNSWYGLPGRLWAHFLMLMLEAVCLYGFSQVSPGDSSNKSLQLAGSITMLVLFS